MKSSFLNLIMIFLFYMSQSSFAQFEENRHTIKYLPYSSTYLPNKFGEIINTNNTFDEKLASVGYLQGLDQSSLTMSPFQKLDLIRNGILNTQVSLVEKYGDEYFDKSREGWEGYCDHWSAANTNPLIPNLINDSAAVICDGILLSRGELKELFTALYDPEKEDMIMWGHRNDAKEHPGKDAHLVYEKLGFDDLAAHDFHQQVIQSLENNETVVIDVDPGYQVWNHPIIEYQVTSKIISRDEIIDNPTIFDRLPSYIFQVASEPAEDESLSEKENSKRKKSLQKMQKNLADLQEKEKELIAIATAKDGWFVSSKINSRFESLDSIKEELLKDKEKRLIDLNEEYKIRLVNGHTTLLIENKDFATQDIQIPSTTSNYLYVLIEKNDEVIDSFWISEASQRPDFMWKNTRNIEEVKEGTHRMVAASDLYHLIKYNECVKIERVIEFLDQLEPLLASSVFQEAWLKSEAHSFKDIIPYIPKKQFKLLEERYGRSLEIFYDQADSKL